MLFDAGDIEVVRIGANANDQLVIAKLELSGAINFTANDLNAAADEEF